MRTLSCWCLAGVVLVVGLVARPAQPEPGPAPDERLNAPMPDAIQDRVLEEAFAQLAGPHHVSLTTTSETAWQRVTVFSRERPLREVMDGLAELLNAEWRAYRSGDGPPRYRLEQTAEARRDEERLWGDLLERSAAPLFRLVGYVERPAEQWAALRAGDSAALPADPLLRPRRENAGSNLDDLGRADSHAALGLLATLPAEQRGALFETEQLFLPYRAMTPRQRELARVVVGQPPRIADDDPWLADLPDDEYQRKIETGQARLARSGLRLGIWRDPQSGAVTRYMAGIELGGTRGASLPATEVEASLLPVRGRPYPRTRGQPAESDADLERRPFPRDFQLDPKGAPSWSDVVAELGRHLSLPLYSDDFSGTRDWSTLAARAGEGPQRRSLAEGLDALCRAHGKLWWREGEALYFRSRAWFVEQRYEVPPLVLARLGEQIDPERGLTPAALGTLAGLTLQQLQGLSAATIISGRRSGRGNLDRGRAHYWTARAYPLLSFAATLSEAQRRQMLGDGLRPAQMSPAQREAFLTLAAYHNGLRALDRPETLRFRIRHYPPRKPTRPGEPWTTNAMLQCADTGIASPFFVSFTPPERKQRPRAQNPERGTP